MSRLIDADALLAEILEKPNIRYSNLDLIKTIGDSQTVDAVQVVQGEWLEKKVSDVEIEQWQSCRCSCCRRYDTRPYLYYFSEPQYCSFCGAKMYVHDINIGKMDGKENSNE